MGKKDLVGFLMMNVEKSLNCGTSYVTTMRQTMTSTPNLLLDNFTMLLGDLGILDGKDGIFDSKSREEEYKMWEDLCRYYGVKEDD